MHDYSARCIACIWNCRNVFAGANAVFRASCIVAIRACAVYRRVFMLVSVPQSRLIVQIVLPN